MPALAPCCVILFFLTIRSLPNSTLFPYTTLFRSPQKIGVAYADILTGLYAVIGIQAALRERERDRKSTRLNSSHLGNSYAVFCLKKKTRRRPSVKERIA